VSKVTPSGSVNRARAQALVTTWQADYPDPQDMLSLTFAGDSPRNTQGAILPQADDQMARADTIFETSREVERTTLYQSAEQELVTNVATCPILQNQLFYRLRTYVKNFAMDSRGLFPNDAWVTATIAAH
jgi:oligopeptide transport system substrate-binding protein